MAALALNFFERSTVEQALFDVPAQRCELPHDVAKLLLCLQPRGRGLVCSAYGVLAAADDTQSLIASLHLISEASSSARMGAVAFELLCTKTLCMLEFGCFGGAPEANDSLNPPPSIGSGYGVLVHGTVLSPSRTPQEVLQKLQLLKETGGVRAVPIVAGTLLSKHSSRYRFLLDCQQQRGTDEDATRASRLYDFMSSRGGPWAEASQKLSQVNPHRIGQIIAPVADLPDLIL